MVSNFKIVGLLFLFLVSAGCSDQFGATFLGPNDSAIRPVVRPNVHGLALATNARTVEEFDTTTAAERKGAAAPLAVSTGAHLLGTTIATLGNPVNPGFWLVTPLVTESISGRVAIDATGASVTVQLIPTDGSETGGSRISLAAMRLLGVPLTGLVELKVFSN